MKQNIKKIIATGGLVTTMMLVNAGVASAQIPDIAATDLTEPMQHSFRHEKRFENKLAILAVKAGLDPEELQHMDNRRTIKQLLKEHGITETELQQALGNHHGRASRNQ